MSKKKTMYVQRKSSMMFASDSMRRWPESFTHPLLRFSKARIRVSMPIVSLPLAECNL